MDKTLVVFEPKTVAMVKAGRMIMFYDVTGLPADAEPKTGEHICSFFHEHKALWAAKCFADAGATVLTGKQKNGAKKVRRIKK